ncbi:MAG: FprA family A-type flavoprotein [Methanobrevibacter sp.]|jgi:flavorubredoxin|nr:FprA family A-type flavoprotein [Candidatus Methanovirga basalitermitum]
MMANSIKIDSGVYWVGAIDWDIRDYHGYKLDGTTYNCYLVFGNDKVALIDNVYPGFSSQLLGRISDAFKKEDRDLKIDVVIQNHIEMDHIHSLYEIIEKFPDVEVYSSTRAVSGIKNLFPKLKDFEIKTVKTGDSIDLGGKSLTFVEASMLHWPDSMFSFLNEDGILFSNDAFGQHICLSERFDHEISNDMLMRASKKFFANLITPSSQVLVRKLDEVDKLGVLDKIKMIAPAHGQIWTKPEDIVNAYKDWATGVCKDKITFIYDTMHHSTQKMAHAMIEGVFSEGFEVKTFYLHPDERSDLVTDVLDSKAICVGSPTMMNNPFPSLGDIIFYFNCLSFSRTGSNKKAVVFGSKGWGGGAVKKLSNDLKQAGFEIFEEYDVLNIPHEEELNRCYEIGKKLAQSLK